MRKHRHVLLRSKSGKTVYLCMEFGENGKTKRIYLAKVHGWKADLACKYFNFESNGWNDDVARAFVGLNALRLSKDEWEAKKFINVVKGLNKLELHFWASKFLGDRERADRAWRAMYEG